MIDLRCGDARAVLTDLPAGSAHALVTDPPAGVSFRGQEWDGDKGGRAEWIAWLATILAECRRVLLPGGYALVWALPRTSHWTAWALEDAGFEIRDNIPHLFGSGFPKSRSCLKPGHEGWLLARAPGPLQPLQINACSVPPAGRWPSNVVFSHSPDCVQATGQCAADCPVRALDAQAGRRTSGTMKAGTPRANTGGYHGAMPERTGRATYGDSGGASRYYPTLWPDPEDATVVPFRYVPKASRRERDAGLADMEPRRSDYRPADPDENSLRTRLHGSRPALNHHATVKPVALMAWLVRLVTPPGGTVCDPFCGSGSTGVACVREGLGFIGIEQDPDYVEIARRRLAHAQQGGHQMELPLDVDGGNR